LSDELGRAFVQVKNVLLVFKVLTIEQVEDNKAALEYLRIREMKNAPKELERVLTPNGKVWFRDGRLREFRNVKDLHDRVLFSVDEDERRSKFDI